jgi:hypothetical protein
MKSAHLVYSLLCDDVRLEMGNRLSLMGVFEILFLQTLPATMLKCAVVNHWVGSGDFETQVRIVSPDGRDVAVSAPSSITIDPQGYADNVTFFTNVTLERAGTYTVRTYLDGRMSSEKPLYVRTAQPLPTSVN